MKEKIANHYHHKNDDNFLLICPKRNTDISWNEKENKISLKKTNARLLDKFLGRFMKIPEMTTIDLDRFGSAVWKMCDGNNTIKDIGDHLERKFGDNIKPTYPRLVEFIILLHSENLVELNKKE
ncbi:MAG: PqqD family protein [Candidatus Eremiobacteraeota bacterium]|nr:PqqD family protein [Candidatus Eremiobacteraeota bacterium]